jgi:hypothetical protein
LLLLLLPPPPLLLLLPLLLVAEAPHVPLHTTCSVFALHGRRALAAALVWFDGACHYHAAVL